MQERDEQELKPGPRAGWEVESDVLHKKAKKPGTQKVTFLVGELGRKTHTTKDLLFMTPSKGTIIYHF